MLPLSLEEFHNPPADARLAPFWFWNGAMPEATVRQQVRQMKDGGCGGFFIHPRQGLTLPYLSKQWFARVRVAVEEAKSCGLQAWLYDEYPYPSGIAGGLVTANRPELRARTLKTIEFVARGGETVRREFPLGRLICALAAPIENGVPNWQAALDVRAEIGVVLTRELFWYWPMGHIPTNEKRFMADEGRLVLEWTPPGGSPSGEWQIFVGVEVEQRGFKYYDCFFDPLAPGAVEEFIKLTHQRYFEEVGEFFGDTIPGIFTDETEPPAWSPEIERALDLDFARVLPALKRDDYPDAGAIRYQMRETALKLFGERWEEPIARWCREHNLIWGAEKPKWRAAQFWNIAEPSTDAGHRRIPAPPEPLTADLRANHRAAMAAAQQCGTQTVRCECFHSLGWGATLQDQKWQFDWLCVQGVNRWTPHAFYATSAGLAKHDAAPSFFAENPSWAHFRLLGDYVGRLGLAMSAGRERARIALLHPHETIWCGGDAATAALKSFETLQNELLAGHFIFHPVDNRALLEAESKDGGLEIGHARYEILLVPSQVGAEGEAAIERAHSAGLTVWRENWLEHLEARRELFVRDASGREIAEVWALWRETDEQNLLFFANTSGENQSAHIEIKSGAESWEVWSLESGEIAPLNSENGRFDLELPPYASAFVVGTARSSATTGLAPSSNPRIIEQSRLEEGGSPAPVMSAHAALVLSPEDTWQIALDRPNALRLNRWQARTKNGEWRAIEALPLRHLDQRGGRGWYNQLEREEGETVFYRRAIECEWVPDDLQILIENGAIAGDWSLSVNDAEVPRAAFSPLEYNGADKTAANVAALFQVGENTLSIRVENAHEMGGLRTPIHLLGSFALQNRVLMPLPTTARFGDLVNAGLPHFSGAATYSKTLDLGADVLELPRGFGDIAEVRVGGQTLGVRAWSPYSWNCPTQSGSVAVEIIVTNTLLPFVEGQTWDAENGVAQSF